MSAVEVNFDGLVGPTHNYGGLAHGNVASAANEGQTSNPREAALQGLAKMRWLILQGLTQGVLPPHERPHVSSLRKMGFGGSDADVIRAVAKAAPLVLENASSASAMWTANAATVSPSADTGDKRVHLTPANLSSHFHRAIEAETTSRVLKTIFADEKKFAVHRPVPFATFSDEGAANHLRLAPSHGERGVEVFVYGRSAFDKAADSKFKARQTLEASHVIATQHQLSSGSGAMFVRQSRRAIDAGAFHNDVVSVSNESVLMFHEEAFEDQTSVLDGLKRACTARGFDPVFLEAKAKQVSLPDAVSTYLFNSQLVSMPNDGGMNLILPVEAGEHAGVQAFISAAMNNENGLISGDNYFDLRQSMRNGGGPACLRLRVVLTEDELAALGAAVILDEAKVDALEEIVERRYRDRLTAADLADPALLDESRAALDEIGQVLKLGPVHDFQRV